MASEQLFQASRDGDVEQVRTLLAAEDASTFINNLDESNNTAIVYAAKNGHVDVVRELLQHGADKNVILEQGVGMEHEAISSLFAAHGEQYAVDGEHAYNADLAAGMPMDPHGGQQMPDGAISYLNAGEVYGQGYPMMQHFGAGVQYGQPFYGEGMMPSMQQNFNHSRRNGSGHGRKDSNVINLPPPEIARMIPCKYFPNCRYGDKCVFAHPIGMSGHMPPPPPPQGHPMSPTLSSPPPPHMQPGAMFYPQMPPGYPYPPFGGAPQHIMAGHIGPMGHNMQAFHHGLPPHFVSPVSMHPQQHDEQPQVQASEQGEESSAAVQTDGPTESTGDDQNGDGQDSAATNAAPLDASTQSVEKDAETGDAEADVDSSSEEASKSRKDHSTSALHHEAAPFQPQAARAESSNYANGVAGTSQRALNGKSARRTGVNGAAANGFSTKRSNNNGERPACTFFQNGRCKYGDECRFPHLLADGTDARPYQAQQRQAFNAQMSLLNGANGAGVRPNGSSNANSSAPATAPTAPQADKRAAQQQAAQTTTGQQQGTTQQAATASSSSTGTNAKGSAKSNTTNANGIVRSQPSKTSSQNNASSSRGQSGGKKQSRQQQQQQRVPTTSDFPALSPNPNVYSSAASPLDTPPIAVNSTSKEELVPSVSASKIAPPSKVNFSAILSAPAPVKSKAAENGQGDAKAAQPESTASNPEPAEVDTSAEAKASSPVPPPKTHAAAAAAAIAGSANGPAVVIRPTQTKVNGAPVKDKASTRGSANGTASKESKPSSYKAAITSAPQPKINGANGTAGSDDEFQLVNRSRSSHKRPSHSGSGKGDNYAPQAKAVAA